MDYRIRLQVNVGGDDGVMYGVDIVGETPWGSTDVIQDISDAIVTAQRKMIAGMKA